jgi:hypothetical protein
MAFRPKSNLHALPRETADSGERWRIIWDTKRRGAGDGRNTALEKFEADALGRARHLLRMGFVVYEIRAPQGTLFLGETAIKARLGLAAESSDDSAEAEKDAPQA